MPRQLDTMTLIDDGPGYRWLWRRGLPLDLLDAATAEMSVAGFDALGLGLFVPGSPSAFTVSLEGWPIPGAPLVVAMPARGALRITGALGSQTIAAPADTDAAALSASGVLLGVDPRPMLETRARVSSVSSTAGATADVLLMAYSLRGAQGLGLSLSAAGVRWPGAGYGAGV